VRFGLPLLFRGIRGKGVSALRSHEPGQTARMSAVGIKDLKTLNSTHVGVEFLLPIVDLEFACGELLLKGESI
jgi:hypothetical protein